ncbi:MULTISPECIES: tRNA (adenosine(37)-N6)-dimethylallyltransferase MiaA [Vagococcus]|uniref:tRNA dimethylallyltransferase n=1 Tax=Vagococcus fluvialis bH819 TaxID=1255619 RepID=A0A1X6WQV8_9ENTE|nr:MULTISPECIES: tRNA (adenosine(37)-N6)-dimethylallyltransferase MiaA [Vagococcus]SLM86684.1 tRNA dimethylallyltransferase [Vagococcus fluvialis bH819]HCM90892.1 tRNA (adenosine(37)-N6)-dimethylallyltransferase MiaA [Vagococcus sp.]
MKKTKVLVIVGPTAVGKTALSIELAKHFNGEIISGDSLQVYKKLDIGTAKVAENEKEGILHHLIDVKEPSESYSAYEFKMSAEEKINQITNCDGLPIVAGGTGMYIQSLLFDFQLGSNEEETEAKLVRKKWETFALEEGKEKLWHYLETIDPLAAKSIHMNNEKRVIRAIEVFEKTGVSILNQQGIDFKDLSQSRYDVKIIGLETDRDVLYDRINQRVDLMMTQGLLEEARYVYELGEVQAIQGIGYKEFFPYFRGDLELEDCVSVVKQHSRQYAKRQLTWFKNRMNVEWYDMIKEPSIRNNIIEEVAKWLKK